MIDQILKDGVLETTTTQGTGTINLGGAQTGYNAVRDEFPDGGWVAYVIQQRIEDGNGDLTGINVERGLGKITYGAPDTLSRDHVLSSSNADAAVDFGAGSKDVFCAPPAAIFGWNLAGVESRTTAKTLNITHNQLLLLLDTTTGAITQNLPAGANIFNGYEVSAMKVDASVNTVTLDGASSDTINGSATLVLASRYDLVRLQWDGTEWKIVALRKNAATPVAVVQNLALSPSVAANALTLAIKTQSGADPSASDTVIVPMRSATLASGAFNLRTITSALSLVISSGSTLGHESTVPGYIYWYLIDNAGTLELAASKRFFGMQGIVSTTAEGGAGAADSATVMYSTSARNDVPFLCIGRTTDTQTTAGTWAAAPTTTQLIPIDDGAGKTHQRIVMAANDADFSLGKHFFWTVNGAATLTISNIPATGDFDFTMKVDHISGAITWPASFQWPENTPPTLTTGKEHLIMGVKEYGSSVINVAALVDYED